MSFVLQQVRELSRKQFFLRALIQKCREKAGLPPMAWTPISLLSGVDDIIAEQIKEWPVCVRFHRTPSCDCFSRGFWRKTPFWFFIHCQILFMNVCNSEGIIFFKSLLIRNEVIIHVHHSHLLKSVWWKIERKDMIIDLDGKQLIIYIKWTFIDRV